MAKPLKIYVWRNFADENGLELEFTRIRRKSSSETRRLIEWIHKSNSGNDDFLQFMFFVDFLLPSGHTVATGQFVSVSPEN